MKWTVCTTLIRSVPLMGILACGMASTPDGTVTSAFKAFGKGDSEGINKLMSTQGLTNAAMFCGGATINCLRQNYAGAGEPKTVKAEVLKKNETAATVQLRTTWSTRNAELCQQFSLDKTNDGWRITFFDSPSSCR